MLERLAPSDVAAVKSDPSLTLAPVTGIGYQGLTINVANGERAKTPLGQDKRVRQALELAIDREAINQVVGAGIYPPAQQPFPEASPYRSDKFPVRARDVEKARALLKEAGHERVPFEMIFGTGTIQQQIAELIQAMVAEAGFDVSLRATEFAAMLKEAQQGNFEVEQVGWSGRVDPDGNIYSFVTCEGNLNDWQVLQPRGGPLAERGAHHAGRRQSARSSTTQPRRSCRRTCRSSTPITSHGRSCCPARSRGSRPIRTA